ncbi:MAG TPA: hypothetical protein VKU01_06450 [Bryobacteraceae bacterium]|nr:hypothetical protein [Bryobacteraceae bacterium]
MQKVGLVVWLMTAACAVGQSMDPSMVKFFNGSWSCAGEFANGRTIAADVAFRSELDGKWLVSSHTDRPPGPYKALSTWGVDRESGKLIAVIDDIAGGVRLFTSDGWANGAVTFERASILEQKPRRERFRYQQQSPDSFKMTYEVSGPEGPWKMGDYIVCTRPRQSP